MTKEHSISTGDLLAKWTEDHFPHYKNANGEIKTAWRNVIATFTVAPLHQNDEWLSRVIPDVVKKSVYLIKEGNVDLPLILSAILYSMSLEEVMGENKKHAIIARIEASIKGCIK